MLIQVTLGQQFHSQQRFGVKETVYEETLWKVDLGSSF